MKSTISFTCLFIVSMLLCGCPYESKVPLDDNPAVKTDPKFLGKWENQKNNKETYIVSKQDDYVYYIEIRENDKIETDKCFAYLSVVNGVRFLNIWDKKPYTSRKQYTFFKVEMAGNKMILSTVTENIAEQFESAVRLKKFFSENMKNSYFFESEKTVLIRTGK